MSLSEAQDERVFGGVVRLKGFAETAENFFVFVLVFLGEYDESRSAESVLERSQAAALPALFSFGSAFEAVAAVGGELPL
jgi:hypothetical protein